MSRIDIDQVALDIARRFIPVDVEGQRRAALQVEIVEAMKAASKRDETMVPLAPGISMPVWLMMAADEISAYMGSRTIGDWKLSGIQKRNDAPPSQDLAKFKDLIGFAAWQAIQLPETDPRRDFIRQANELITMIDSEELSRSKGGAA